MRVHYCEAVYGEEEILAATDVLRNKPLALMCSENVFALEDKVAKMFRKEYGLMSNSGSSANLLAMKSLDLPKGSKVITPALTFITTVAPIVQSELIPYFVDVDIDTLQMDPSILKELDLTGVSAIKVPNLIGNVANWEEIYNFAKNNNLLVIEDSADTIGYTYSTKLNDWSDVSTTSFFASHVITGAGNGGLTAFKEEKHYLNAKSLRGWGRRSALYGETEDYDRRFDCKLDGMDYDDKFVFDELGYNLLPSEISAAFALEQLKKLEAKVDNRLNNFNYIKDAISKSDNMRGFSSYNNVKTGWMSFPLMLTNKLKGKRKEFQIFLEKSGIQTRTVFTGNILRQPVSKKFEWESYGQFNASDQIMENGVLLGCHNKMTREKLDYMILKIIEAEECILK
jgi:CDP-6-deoxy-D-xylo-4-hexulose-3-dehydrase